MENKDALIALQERVEQMLAESEDGRYTRYLLNLNQRINDEKGKVNSLYAEFNRNYDIYQKNKKVPEQSVQPTAVVSPIAIPPATAVSPIAVPPATVIKTKTSVEFKIGAWLFSIIGVLFILAAFVILGTTFMSGIVKGLGLYCISLVFLLVSELVLARKMTKFSLGITGLGICSLYLSTIINYLYLENFNGIVAMVLTLMITGAAIFIGKRKDSAVIKIISFIGCYICFFPIRGFADEINFLTITGILLIVNIMTVFLPVKRVQYGVNITHMASNLIFTGILLGIGFDSGIHPACLLLYSICSIWIQNVIYLIQDRYIRQVENHEKAQDCRVGNICVYCISLFVQFIYLTALTDLEYPERIYVHIAVAVVAVMSFIVFIMQKDSKEKWIQYWSVNVLALMIYWVFGKSSSEVAAVLLTLFVIAKLLGRIRILRVSELVLTLIAAVGGLYYYFDNGTEGFFFAAAFLISILALYHWKSLYEGIITVMLCAFAYMYTPSAIIYVPVCVGILLLGMLGFTNLKFFRGRCIDGYNVCSLVALILIYLRSAFIDNPITYVCLLIFGITIIVVTFQPKYGLGFKGKPLILSVFLTYMAFIFKVDIPIVISILLMLIAVGSVISGFILKKKSQRIYGLILSLFVCLKVVLFDFSGIETIQRMILFLAVGLIILAISGIYILLEKKLNE